MAPKRKNTQNMVNIEPTTGILRSCARTGYSWVQAVDEIVDNCIDTLEEKHAAHPSKRKRKSVIRCIALGKDGRSHRDANVIDKIIISDNGVGMSKDDLPDSLRLGNSGRRAEGSTTLGAFGMGLKTAIVTLGRRVTILSTKTDSSDLCALSWDVDENIENGVFEASLETTPAPLLRKFFENYVGKKSSGTVVVITKLADILPTRNGFHKTLKKKISSTYRHLLSKDSEYNSRNPNLDIRVGPSDPSVDRTRDPLLIGSPTCNILIGGPNGEFIEKSYGDFKYKMRLVHHALDHNNSKGIRAQGLGEYMKTGGTHAQGIYFIREGRQIDCSCPWKSSPNSSNLLGEVIFTDDGLSSSNPIMTDFGKKGVELSDEFAQHFRTHVIGPYLRQVQTASHNRSKKKRAASLSDALNVLEEATTKLPSEHFGVKKEDKKGGECRNKQHDIIERLYQKNPEKRRNPHKNGTSKYGGSSYIKGEDRNIKVTYEDCSWPHSPLPFDVESLECGTHMKVSLNHDHTWIRKNIADSPDTQKAAYNVRIVGAMCLTHMHEEDGHRHEKFIVFGKVLEVFDDELDNYFLDTDDDIPPATLVSPPPQQQLSAEAK
jgi:hypothetical protein